MTRAAISSLVFLCLWSTSLVGCSVSESKKDKTDKADSTSTGFTTTDTATTSSLACTSCAGLLAGDAPRACEGTSEDLANALISCACSGNCDAQCGDNLCTGYPPSDECNQCISDEFTGCRREYMECMYDL